MAAPWQGLPVRLERAPHRGAAFALCNASKRARTRSIGSRSRGSLFLGSRSRGSLFIFRSSPAVAPPGIGALRVGVLRRPLPRQESGEAAREIFLGARTRAGLAGRSHPTT